MTTANKLTILRVLMIPAFLVVVYWGSVRQTVQVSPSQLTVTGSEDASGAAAAPRKV